MMKRFYTEVNGHSFGSYTLSEWLVALSVLDRSKQNDVSSFLLQDWQKIERLLDLNERMGLPIDHYLISDSMQCTLDTPKIREYFEAQGETLFAIRAIPLQSGFAPSRALGITQEECFEYIGHLSQEGGTYRIYIWDYFIPEFSGTIIVTVQGLYAEMVRGKHILLTQQPLGLSNIITANLIFPNYRMVYSTDDTNARAILWQAIKYLIVETSEEISPLSLPTFLKGYFEFTFHPVQGYRFFDFNNDLLIAQIPYSSFTPDIGLSVQF